MFNNTSPLHLIHSFSPKPFTNLHFLFNLIYNISLSIHLTTLATTSQYQFPPPSWTCRRSLLDTASTQPTSSSPSTISRGSCSAKSCTATPLQKSTSTNSPPGNFQPNRQCPLGISSGTSSAPAAGSTLSGIGLTAQPKEATGKLLGRTGKWCMKTAPLG